VVVVAVATPAARLLLVLVTSQALAILQSNCSLFYQLFKKNH
jgi:hypothetical protein